jgi:hypothetical protein
MLYPGIGVPKIESMKVRIATGKSGMTDPVRIRFNNFELPLKTTSGGCGAGETYEGTFRLGSVGHSCTLLGPKTGVWEIESLDVTWDYGSLMTSVTHRFGRTLLKAGEEANILDEPPPAPFDV